MRLKIIAILALLALVGAAGLGGGRALASVNGPELGDPASVVNLEGEEIAAITVTDLRDPFEEYSEFTEPDEGTRFVLVTVEVENTGERPFELSPFRFFMRDTLGRTYGSGFISVEDGFEEENSELEDRNMSSGEIHTGVLYFVVAEDAEISDVLYQSTDNDTSVLISVADLNESEGAPSGDADVDSGDEDATPEAEDAAAGDDEAATDDEDAADDAGSDEDAGDDSADDEAESTPES